MLLGTFAPKLDDKGRIVLPAKFWDELSGGLVMTRGVDRCVFVYSEREFEKMHERMTAAAPTSTKEGRDYERLILSGASQEIPDKQRRVTVPLLGPTIRTWGFLSMIGAIQLFDMVWILTGGGPANSTTTMATFLITEGTKRYNYGIATAASVILFAVALVLAMLYQVFVLRRDVAQADAGSRRVR